MLYRQLVMQDLERNAETLGKIVAGVVPPTGLAATTQAIAKGAIEARDSFANKAPGGMVRPEAWANWDDFSKRMNAFVANSAEMARVGASGDLSSVTQNLVAALPCKDCHDLYRVERTVKLVHPGSR